MQTKAQLTELIKQKALELGFLACGMSKAEALPNDAQRLQTWLRRQMHGKMQYMERNFEKRTNPQLLEEGTLSVISVLLSYFPSAKQTDETAPILSKYAYGTDYHFVLKEKLNLLLDYIKELLPDANGRVFTDSAPVLERTWAYRAGLGWIGKNGNLINQQFGSFFFIGEILLNQSLEYNQIFAENRCGNCTRCLQACPTQAIEAPTIVNGSKCISYLTIENKGAIPAEFEGKLQNRVFGCDICQDVCPWNRKAKPHTTPEFEPSPALMQLTAEHWYQLNQLQFSELFKNSPIKRTKFEGLKRNLAFIQPKAST